MKYLLNEDEFQQSISDRLSISDLQADLLSHLASIHNLQAKLIDAGLLEDNLLSSIADLLSHNHHLNSLHLLDRSIIDSLSIKLLAFSEVNPNVKT